MALATVAAVAALLLTNYQSLMMAQALAESAAAVAWAAASRTSCWAEVVGWEVAVVPLLQRRQQLVVKVAHSAAAIRACYGSLERI